MFFSKKNILVTYLLAVALNSLFFYLIPPGYYDRNVNLALSLAMLAMIPLAGSRLLFSVVVHLTTFMGMVLVACAIPCTRPRFSIQRARAAWWGWMLSFPNG